MLKALAGAMLITVAGVGATPSDARVCRNSHGRHFKCHKVVAPRINLKAHHPVKIQRCRGHQGKFNNC